EVGESKRGMRVVAQARARGVTAVRSEIENARPDKAEMEKSGGRARPTVKYKSERAVLCAVLQNIGCVENRCALLAGLIEKSEGAGGCRIGKLAARRVDRMFRNRIGRQKAEHAFIRRAPLGRILRPVFRDIVSVGGAEGAREQDREHKARESG